MKSTQKYKDLINDPNIIVSPGVYDGYSARLVEAAGFKTAATSGAAIANSVLGIADIGIMGLHENLNQCRNIARSVDIPITCDADTGYGNPVNVFHTTRMFEEAGIAGINIEDQVSPKRCGHMPRKNVVTLDEMVRKIEAACMARRDDDFVIIARTDAISTEGIEAALERAKAYVAAGADLVFPDAIRSEDQIKAMIDTGARISINMGFGIRSRPTTPLIPIPTLQEWGVKRVSLPRMLPAAAIKAMSVALEIMQQSIKSGVTENREDLLVSIDEITDLMGYQSARILEEQLLYGQTPSEQTSDKVARI